MILQGNNLIIKVGNTAIAKAKSCTIDLNVDTSEVCAMNHADWKAHITKRKGWSVSCNHLVTVEGWKSDILLHGSVVTLTMEVRDDTSGSFIGSAIVESVQVNARRGALASGGFKFLGTGSLALVTT